MGNILENFKNFFGKSRKNLGKLKYFGKFRGILPKFLKNISKISRIIAKNLKNYFIKFRILYHQCSKNISKNFGIFQYFLKKVSNNVLKIVTFATKTWLSSETRILQQVIFKV